MPANPHARDRRTWLFNAAEFSGNPKWLFLYTSKMRSDIDSWWITDSAETARRIRKLGFKAVTFRSRAGRSLQERAGVFVVNQVKEQIPERMTGVVLLNLWHGVGVKRIERAMTDGFLLPRIAAKYIRNNKVYRDTQMLLVTSPTMEQHFKTQIDFTEAQVIRAGYPQNEFVRRFGRVETYDHDVRTRQGLPASTEIVMYAPTYRLSGNDDFVHRALPDIEQLVSTLERNGQLLILKMHPQLEADRTYQSLKEKYADQQRLLFWDNRDDVYEIFEDIDLTIVDYSSIHYDLIAAGANRFIRYAFDHEDPTALEPELDYFSLSCGTVVTDFDALLSALGGDNRVEPDELARLSEIFWAYSTPDTFETLVERALTYELTDVALPTLYSFDIFDTVIHRTSVAPVSIFHLVRERAEASNLGFPERLMQRFIELRRQAEAAVREAKRKDPRRAVDLRFEITLDEIYDRLAELYSLTVEQTEQLKAWEIEAEIADTYADDEMVARIRELRAAGETVILISDMYLPRTVIDTMLAKASADLVGLPVFLSNEHGVQKSTGQLYVRAYLDLKYDFGEWIHTGDNPRADVQMAERMGITPVALETPEFDEFETALIDSADTYDAFLLAGVLREARLEGLTESEAFVFRNVSLFLVPYVKWALDDAVARGYSTLYFISRDGHHMKAIADAIIDARGLPIRTAYIFGSRRAWRLASQVDGIDDDTFAGHGSFGGIRSFSSLVEASRLSRDELLELFPEFEQYEKVGTFDGYTAGNIVASLKSSAAYRRRLTEIARSDREVATDYLRQEIDLGERFAFVEYWGRGYTQDCLARLLEEAAGHPVETPFYYARSIYPTEGVSIRHNYTAASESLLLIEAIFANLPYGTTEGYRRAGDRVVPVYRERHYDVELFDATTPKLVEFVKRTTSLPFYDEDRLWRDAFRFGFEHFSVDPTADTYRENLATLRDAVELGGVEREFAPKFRVTDFVAYLRGKPIAEITRSLPLSLARSRGPGQGLLRLQQEVGFRRVWKRNVARIQEATGRLLRQAPVDTDLAAVRPANPPIVAGQPGTGPAESRTGSEVR
ncbi:CDP-glycerol glycerophosphotransferase family protein [Agromyces italicus]|uniref:CDP-glycerol glycerophosphotransferase family protein n=1 Tax=Agromyces italicus TaxID=279572 RepID=UPI0003B67D76|nr:CDP-glycerol glycerophosphotransferase family protein [Agromyces italicus]